MLNKLFPIFNLDKRTEHNPQTLNSGESYIIDILLAICMLVILLARIHNLNFPLERDEGEYAYMGKLILNGHPPYSLAYNMKYPGTYYMYALLISIFGDTLTSIRLGFALFSILSVVLVFKISEFILSKKGALIASVSFGFLATSTGLLGQAAHATHFVTFFTLLATWLLFKLKEPARNSPFIMIIPGILYSFAFICKQSGLFFILWGLSLVIIFGYNVIPGKIQIKQLAYMFTGFIVPVVIMFMYLYFNGLLPRFWFWTYIYLSKYGSYISIPVALNQFILSLVQITGLLSNFGYSGLWAISLISICYILLNKKKGKKELVLLMYIAISFLTVIPGFYFRRHYYVTILPAISILIGLFVEILDERFRTRKSRLLQYSGTLVFLVFLLIGMFTNLKYLFIENPEITCKKIYGDAPFVESLDVSKYILANTYPEDKILVFGSEPQIYFYAQRYSATGYIYTYPVTEEHSFALYMQKEMVNEIEKNNPQIIVDVVNKNSWSVGPKTEKYIFNWMETYKKQFFVKVAYIPTIQGERGKLITILDELPNILPVENYLVIYKRK